MELKSFVAATIFVASASAPFTAGAQTVLTGDTKLACTAILCLASPTRPGECASAIAKYFSISLKRFSSTLKARKNFLSLCPQVDQATVEQIVNSNPPEQDPPEPMPTPVPVIPLTREQIEARLAELVPIWEAQLALSAAARTMLEKCIERNFQVQNGACGPEYADYTATRRPIVATRDEIDRLQALLDNRDCSKDKKFLCVER